MIVKVTGTLTFDAPLAVTVIAPLYVPAARVPAIALTVTVPFPVPDEGVSLNQLIFSLALQVNVPPPTLLMVSSCVGGSTPPCCAVNDKVRGAAPIAGGDGGDDGGGDDGGGDDGGGDDGGGDDGGGGLVDGE